MISNQVQTIINGATIHIADYRGSTPEEIADRAIEKIMYVGDNTHPVIAEQARAFKEQIRALLIHYLREAQTSERTTICGHLIKGGHADLADIIRSI
jgi:hypothetical protein